MNNDNINMTDKFPPKIFNDIFYNISFIKAFSILVFIMVLVFLIPVT